MAKLYITFSKNWPMHSNDLQPWVTQHSKGMWSLKILLMHLGCSKLESKGPTSHVDLFRRFVPFSDKKWRPTRKHWAMGIQMTQVLSEQSLKVLILKWKWLIWFKLLRYLVNALQADDARIFAGCLRGRVGHCFKLFSLTKGRQMYFEVITFR